MARVERWAISPLVINISLPSITKKFVTNWAIISITRRSLSWSYVRLTRGVEMHSWNGIHKNNFTVVNKYQTFEAYEYIHLCLEGRSRRWKHYTLQRITQQEMAVLINYPSLWKTHVLSYYTEARNSSPFKLLHFPSQLTSRWCTPPFLRSLTAHDVDSDLDINYISVTPLGLDRVGLRRPEELHQ